MSAFQKVVDWLRQWDNVVNQEELKRDLSKHWDQDGFQFCKNLEKGSWECDAELVEILDDTKREDFK